MMRFIVQKFSRTDLRLIDKQFCSVCFLKHEGIFFIRAPFHFVGPVIIKNQR